MDEDLANFIHRSPGVAVVLDAQLRIRAASRAARRLLGPDITGVEFISLTAPADAAELARNLDRARGDTAVERTLTTRLRDHAGAWHRVALAGEAITSGPLDGGVLLTGCTLADQADPPPQRIAAVGRLSAAIAHDFNNALQTILGSASLIVSDAPAGSSFAEDARAIIAGARRAQLIVEQLRAFSRRETQRLKREEIDSLVASFVRVASGMLPPSARLETSLNAPGIACLVDGSQILRALDALVRRALSAMSGVGTVTITTSLSESDEAFNRKHPFVPIGSYGCIDILDTGRPIEPERLPHLFDPLTSGRLNHATLADGMSLAAVYGVVKQSHGFIIAASGPNGSCFRLLFAPAAAETVAAARPASAVAPAVLIVDGDDDGREAMTRNLRSHGIRVLEARNQGEAFVRCELYAGVVDVVVLCPPFDGTSPRDLTATLLVLFPKLTLVTPEGAVSREEMEGVLPADRIRTLKGLNELPSIVKSLRRS